MIDLYKFHKSHCTNNDRLLTLFILCRILAESLIIKRTEKSCITKCPIISQLTRIASQQFIAMPSN
ncbi:MAG: hypothetical protein CMF46_01835 [Legionellales bacterium]|nr:hypothetical protein [Legionellales bacterium]